MALYFALARGTEGCTALDMSKHLDSNYHSLVPELELDFTPEPDFSLLIDRVEAGQKLLGKEAAVPLVVGPLTLVLLARLAPGLSPSAALHRILPAYSCTSPASAPTPATAPWTSSRPHTATWLPRAAPSTWSSRTATSRQPYWERQLACLWRHSAWTSWASGGGDANRTAELVAELAKAGGWPAGLRLGAGIVDGRAVWKDDADTLLALLAGAVLPGHQAHQRPEQRLPAAPALGRRGGALVEDPNHATHAASGEPGAAPRAAMSRGLTAELRAKSGVCGAEGEADRGGHASRSRVSALACALSMARRGGVAAIPADCFRRSEAFAVRRSKQPQFRAFPTSTIGSFPQTAEVRRARAQLTKGLLTLEQYQARMDALITHAIGVQEGLDIDVLVHGEAERTDMVEYFGEQLEGLTAFTANAWVQSYGSRYVRPHHCVDVACAPMTVREWRSSQTPACTGRFVKGMLTGPVTILNWSFPRKDVSRRVQAMQLALACARRWTRCRIVQVDEPALREGLPLKNERWQSYLTWAVDAFRLSTAVARPDVQIVTHLCYSNFEDILQAVDDMDADVLTIENSRSGDEMVRALSNAGYCKDLGPGVYDVHSPVVPPVEWFVDKIASFVATCEQFKDCPDRLWVNPDCGLKTRAWSEVIPALRNMVQAAQIMRERHAKQQPVAGSGAATPTGVRRSALASAAAPLAAAAEGPPQAS
uniref:5-methyltetrahydropteroyltriglutamate--homocysteine S-methyltransferase n=1 Tax=Chlamydomonas moewusii TaxID=3054 RepID=Q9ZRA6_CHLMO|nr:cobalamin independent methionine synthase [Chlamydomonas moewusii]